MARNHGTATWPEYVRTAREGEVRPRAHTFLWSQGIERVLRVWGGLVEPDRLHVLTVPARAGDPARLWHRFAEVLGVHPDTVVLPETAANRSAGYGTAHLLCLLHQAAAAAGLPAGEVRRMAVYVAQCAALDPGPRTRPPLDQDTAAFCADWNARTRAAVEASGAAVTGSLEDLPVVPTAPTGVLAPPDDAETLHAVGLARVALGDLLDDGRPTRPAERAGGACRLPSTGWSL